MRTRTLFPHEPRAVKRRLRAFQFRLQQDGAPNTRAPPGNARVGWPLGRCPSRVSLVGTKASATHRLSCPGSDDTDPQHKAPNRQKDASNSREGERSVATPEVSGRRYPDR